LRRIKGFTLIEMMVTLAMIVVLLLIAIPSFRTFQQRAALRSASESVLGFWNQARLEAGRRNQMVKVGVKVTGTSYCLGAQTTTSGADQALCDCFTANACDVAAYPGNQQQWNGATLSKVTLGTSDWPTVATNKTAVIEPNRSMLTETGDAGVIQISSPSGPRAYLLNLQVDAFGRAQLCESTSVSAANRMSDYSQRRCAP
jgi:prepilin-type N-terminal cleavage/methylation domain-containing protein